MTKILHVGYGYLTNQGEDEPLTFSDEAEALEYLANCGESENIGIDWEVV